MTIRLVGESEIRLEMDTKGFAIEPAGAISPFHLLAASLASCTALAIESWSHAMELDVTSLVIGVQWELAEERPARVTRIDTSLCWPDLPADREMAVRRLVELCGIHATLERSADMGLHVTSAC